MAKANIAINILGEKMSLDLEVAQAILTSSAFTMAKKVHKQKGSVEFNVKHLNEQFLQQLNTTVQ